MIRSILLTLGTMSTLAAGSLVTDGRGTAAPAPIAHAVSTGGTGLDRPDVVDDAVAAAVIGSIAAQFDTADVTVKLDDVAVIPASIQDREVRGEGRVRVGADGGWIPFRVTALYDAESTEVTYPRLVLGQAQGEAIAADASIVHSLDARVAKALRAEFADQPVAWSLDRATVTGGDARYLQVRGSGVADFGAEGSAQTQVDALYDRRTGQWLRVNYELGVPAEDAPAQAAAVASV